MPEGRVRVSAANGAEFHLSYHPDGFTLRFVDSREVTEAMISQFVSRAVKDWMDRHPGPLWLCQPDPPA